MGEFDTGSTNLPNDGVTPPEGTPSAGSQNADASGGGDKTVPYPRFQQVIAQKNEAIEKAERAEAALKALTGHKPDPEAGPVAPEGLPPADLTPEAKLDWLMHQAVAKHGPAIVNAALKSELGMDLSQLKTYLPASVQQVKQNAVERYNAACREAGLDPEDENVRAMAAGICQVKECGPEDAVKAIVAIRGGQPTQTADLPSTDVVLGGLAGITTVADNKVPGSFQEAAAMAADGKAIKQLSAVDILAATGSKPSA